MNDENRMERADTSVRPYTTRAGGPCPYTDQSPTMGKHKANLYGILFTVRLLTLHGASLYAPRRINRPILPRECKISILHILRYLRGEETRRNK
jgi:hypothetical protein